MARSWWQRLLPSPPLGRDLAILFRSLSVLQDAGIHVVRSLEVMSNQLEHAELREALGAALLQVNAGHRLSKALSHFPWLFPPIYLQLLAVGESTGSLHRILNRLADLAETSMNIRHKIKSALMYPAFIALFCTALLFVLPGLVFRDLLTFLTELKVPLPATTRSLIVLSNLVNNPVFPILAVGLSVLVVVGARHLLRQTRYQLLLERAMLRLPAIGPALQAAWVGEFCRALGYAYAAGVPILKAVQLAGEGSSALLRQAMPEIQTRLKGGSNLTKALAETELFPPISLSMLEAGEESGRSAEMLERAARCCEEVVDERLNLATAMLQPLVMLAVGLMVGYMVIATMSPMVRVLDKL